MSKENLNRHNDGNEQHSGNDESKKWNEAYEPNEYQKVPNAVLGHYQEVEYCFSVAKMRLHKGLDLVDQLYDEKKDLPALYEALRLYMEPGGTPDEKVRKATLRLTKSMLRKKRNPDVVAHLIVNKAANEEHEEPDENEEQDENIDFEEESEESEEEKNNKRKSRKEPKTGEEEQKFLAFVKAMAMQKALQAKASMPQNSTDDATNLKMEKQEENKANEAKEVEVQIPLPWDKCIRIIIR